MRSLRVAIYCLQKLIDPKVENEYCIDDAIDEAIDGMEDWITSNIKNLG